MLHVFSLIILLFPLTYYKLLIESIDRFELPLDFPLTSIWVAWKGAVLTTTLYRQIAVGVGLEPTRHECPNGLANRPLHQLG